MENVQFKYASESTRAINRIIDLLVCYFPFWFLKYGWAILQLAFGSDTTNSFSFSTGFFIFLLMIVEFIYYFVFEMIFGKTIAKFITRTQVIDFKGQQPNFQKIILRTCCRFIPFDWMSFINNKTGWHDDFSETRVINKLCFDYDVGEVFCFQKKNLFLTKNKHLKTQTQYPEIYTDGSCHTQLAVGAWVAIILFDNKKIILKEVEKNTTHQRMELMAVIKAIEYIKQQESNIQQVKIISDSQYVIGLNDRRKKLEAAGFKSNAGRPINNTDLIQQFFLLANKMKIEFEKIKAHQKQTAEHNYNIDADKLCRKLVRDAVSLT